MSEKLLTQVKTATEVDESVASGQFAFRKVDDFYHDLDKNLHEWGKFTQIEAIEIKDIAESHEGVHNRTNDQLLLILKDNNNILRYLAIDFITADIFRLRFNPAEDGSYYTETNTSFTVQDKYSGLRKAMDYYAERFSAEVSYDPYTYSDVVKISETADLFSCITTDANSGKGILQIDIDKTTLVIRVSVMETNEEIWVCNLGKTYFKAQISYDDPNKEGTTNTDYSVVVNVDKPATAKYIGFGEKGGATLCKNSQQLSYFNFDNMRYRSVHGIGALDSREPLYHTNPFFLEFYGTPETKNGVYGTFVNNPSQILMDVGHTYSNELRIATSYGDMDLGVSVGATSKEVLSKYTTISGKARLKPRYALGFHQGGYGYENTPEMLDVVNGYGDSDVPFDGLHVDIDVQNYYRTFTMNEEKYRRICLGVDNQYGPIDSIGDNNIVLIYRGAGNEKVQAKYPDGTPVYALYIDGEIIEAHYVYGRLEPWKNEDGTNKKAGLFLFEHLLAGHKTWTTRTNLKVKCSTNITPVISNPYVMENNDKAGMYRTLKSGIDNDYFVKYRKVIADEPEDRAKHDGSDYGETNIYLGGVYYGQDAEKKELGSFGHYPDFGNKDARLWWGQQYKELVKAGLSMVWQDMTTPAISINQYPQEVGESWFNFMLWNGEKNIYKGSEGENLCCSYKSFPFNILLTDNFDKRYKRGADVDKLSPAGKIRNLYSYNLHKATYHGLNNIWKINEMSFTWVVLNDKALTKTQSQHVLNQLLASGGILQETVSTFSIPCYVVITENIEQDVQNALSGTDYEPVADQVCQVLYDAKNLQDKSNERNFIVGRGGFSGMHRFAALWTGDNASTWDFLKINVAQMLALGLSGQPIAGADIGGFENPEGSDGKWADPELVTRWTTLGAFLPWFRNHYRRKGTKDFQELYKFQDYALEAPFNERFMYHSVLPVSRMYVKLRYQMLQLFYDAMFENTITGLPIVRPMFLQDEQDTQLFNDKLEFLNSQFFVGKDFMVAGIMDKQREVALNHFEAKRDIYFPTGSYWYQFLQNKKSLAPAVVGGTTIEYDAVINHSCADPNSEQLLYVLPMYVREGGILPMTESERYSGAYYEDNGESMPITINVYPSPNQKTTDYTMYLDDGKSRSSAPVIKLEYGGDPEAKDEYREVCIKHTPSAQWDRTINLDRKQDNMDPDTYNLCPYYFIALPHDPYEPIVSYGPDKDSICEVKINGRTIPFFAATDNGQAINDHFNNSAENNWYYNTYLNTSYIKVYEAEKLEISFTYKK